MENRRKSNYTHTDEKNGLRITYLAISGKVDSNPGLTG